MLDEEQHHQAAGVLQNSRQASGQRQTQSAYWWKRRHSWVAVAESGRQTSEPREISRDAGDPSIICFADYSQSSASQVIQEKARSTQLTETHSMHALFSAYSLRDDNVITSKRTWKLKNANSILEPSEYFCQISSKSINIILSYTVSKLGRFLRHSVVSVYAYSALYAIARRSLCLSHEWISHKRLKLGSWKFHHGSPILLVFAG